LDLFDAGTPRKANESLQTNEKGQLAISRKLAPVEAAGIEPVSRESQWQKLERLTSATDPVAAYLQLLNDTQGHPLAQTELDPAYVLTRWPQLPDHIRQTIMTLLRSMDSTTAPPP
jgi:DNA-binding transcriptional ArsR family regulator